MKLYRTLLLLSVGFAAVFVARQHRSPVPLLAPSVKTSFAGAVGERFDHDSRISVSQNPHGESDRTYFEFSGRLIGTMYVTASLPSVSHEIMKEVIIKHTKNNYGATSVAHSALTNRNGYVFDHFSSDAHKDGRAYHYELYLHETKPLTPSIADSYLRQMLGMHKFEFFIASDDAAEVLPLIRDIIDSFQVPRR